MQTFLPHPDFDATFSILDPKRLRNQINETVVLIKAITGETKAWAHHPAALMWTGHVGALASYGVRNCEIVEERLNEDRTEQALWLGRVQRQHQHDKLPPWIGWPEFHACHRANLKRKDPVYYGAFPEAPDSLYCWPIRIGGLWQARFKRVGAKAYEALDMAGDHRSGCRPDRAGHLVAG